MVIPKLSLGRTGRARAARKGQAGYDNPRENIDPHVKTKVVSTQEIGSSKIISGGGIVGTEISGANIQASGTLSGANIFCSGHISGAELFLSNNYIYTAGNTRIYPANRVNYFQIYDRFTSIGIASNVGSLYQNNNHIPERDDTYILGVSTGRWKNLYMSSYISGAGAVFNRPVSGSHIYMDGSISGSRLFISGGNYVPAKITRERTATTWPIGLLNLHAKATTNMGNGFGAAMDFTIEDNAGVENTIASIAARRAGTDNTGKFQMTVYAAGTPYKVLDAYYLGFSGSNCYVSNYITAAKLYANNGYTGHYTDGDGGTIYVSGGIIVNRTPAP